MIIFTLQYVHIIFHLFPHMSNAGFHADSVDSVSALKCVQVSTSGSSAIPHELLYGHAGYLYSLLFVSFNLPVMSAGLDELIEHQVDVLLKQGERQAREQGVWSTGRGPRLMYSWHEKHYLGAAHGLVGVLTVLLQASLLKSDLVSLC